MKEKKDQMPGLARATLSLLAGLLLLAALCPGGVADAGAAILAAPPTQESAAGAPTPQRAPLRTVPVEPNPPGTGFIPPPMDLSHLDEQWKQREATPQALPASFDWRNVGGTNYVTPVKDQGNCGSCYAFGALGNFESKLLIDGAGTFDLSENNAKECNWREVNNFQYQGTPWGSCDGGNTFMIASLFSQKGTVLESCDPYVDSDVSCNASCAYQQTLLDWRLISQDVLPAQVLKQYLYDHGPLIVSMYADSFQGFNGSYDGSYTFNYTSLPGRANHSVLIVGWSNNLPPVFGGVNPATGWIVKNSWGTSWGAGGYFYITYGSANIGLYPSYVEDWQSYDPNGNLWYYDDDGWWETWGYNNPTAWALAKFTADHNTNVNRVEFWTTDATTDVDVYLYDSFDGTTLGSLLASKLNNSFAEAGYHSVALDTPVPVTNGNDVVAVVKFTNATFGYPVVADPHGTVETGRTYISSNGSSWSDMGSEHTDLAIRVRTSTTVAAAPTMTSITPNSGENTGTVHITNLAGSNFQAGATVKLTRSGQADIDATNVVRVSASQITCDLNLSGRAAGAWDVVVTNHPDAQSGTLPNGFTVVSAPGEEHYVYLPMVAKGFGLALTVDPTDRQASLDFYSRVYLASEGVAMGWTGNHATCNEGSTSQEFRQAVLLRINYFRAMAGVPAEVTFSDEYTRKAQKAALMMSRNRQLSHDPPPSWFCYSAEGHEAAGNSNLYLGVYSWQAIDGYVQDPGTGNYAVGHRRWVLYPQTQQMGTGDIPPASGYPAANALWVFDDHMWEPRPTTREEYVAWPPPGYVPYQVVFPRWSFAYDEADFSIAQVSMTSGGSPVPVTVRPVADGFGENTLVWEPSLSFGSPPASDTRYTVSVSNVRIAGSPRSFVYDVIIFDPGGAGLGSWDVVAKGQLGIPPVPR
jgi:C1A family cysteine protease